MDTGNKGKSQESRVKKSGTRTYSPAIFYITKQGHKLAQKIQSFYENAQISKFTSAGAIHELPLLWNSHNNLIFIMATGIVVRSIASLLKDKRTDPAVVVLDERGQFVISLVSGHIGGANALARTIAEYLGAQAVITTASDVQGKVALDIWAAENNLIVQDTRKLKEMSARIVNGKTVHVYSDVTVTPETVPDEFQMVDDPGKADIIISDRVLTANALFMRPASLVAGIGCNRGTRKEEIETVVHEIMREHKLSPHSLRGLASIDLKRDEEGLIEYARDNNVPILFFSADELNTIAFNNELARSKAAETATGAVAVAEPAALLAAGQMSDKGMLIVTKQKRGNVTLAIAQAEFIL